jgi:NAD(P)H-flavin reductase
MTHTISVAGTDIAFPCPPGMTILEAAQAGGWDLPYSCRKGVCETCRGGVISGHVSEPLSSDRTVLFCRAKPASDVEIAPGFAKKVDLTARKIVEAKVFQITRPADDVAILQIRFPAGKRVKFQAGQYLDILFEKGLRRSFSMANPPQQSDGVELHIRVVPGGYFSQTILPSLARGAPLRLELPFGNFGLKANSKKAAILVASGTGFAPMKSIIEDAIRQGMPQPLALYWGARTRKDLYLLELAQRWETKFSQFRFVPVLSEPSDAWAGRTGLVHQTVMEDHQSLARHDVYACGVPAMINAARHDFAVHRGMPADAFSCDAFVTPAD